MWQLQTMDFIENLRDVDWDRVLLQGSETLGTLELWYQSDLDRLLWRSVLTCREKILEDIEKISIKWLKLERYT